MITTTEVTGRGRKVVLFGVVEQERASEVLASQSPP
jgi:hypothetical protein